MPASRSATGSGEALDLGRNHFDRLGHFAQGFVPAILGREILLRTSPLRPGKWLFFIVVCICLAFSAFYELIEWWSAAILGAAADDFLGTQGDVWDTQWDMFLALVGSLTAQLALSRLHDRELEHIPLRRGPVAAAKMTRERSLRECIEENSHPRSCCP